jgi:hypothetical protein
MKFEFIFEYMFKKKEENFGEKIFIFLLKLEHYLYILK